MLLSVSKKTIENRNVSPNLFCSADTCVLIYHRNNRSPISFLLHPWLTTLFSFTEGWTIAAFREAIVFHCKRQEQIRLRACPGVLSVTWSPFKSPFSVRNLSVERLRWLPYYATLYCLTMGLHRFTLYERLEAEGRHQNYPIYPIPLLMEYLFPSVFSYWPPPSRKRVLAFLHVYFSHWIYDFVDLIWYLD